MDFTFDKKRTYTVEVIVEPEDRKYGVHKKAFAMVEGKHPIDVAISLMNMMDENEKYRDYIFSHEDFIDWKGETFQVLVRTTENVAPMMYFMDISEDSAE